jgi:hypothetical protein
MASQVQGRPTLEEEKRRELVLQTLNMCGVADFEPEVVGVLTRWLAQESKSANQDKRAELLSRDIPPEAVSKLILESLGISGSDSSS